MSNNLFEKMSVNFQRINIIHIILVSFSLHMLVISFPNLPILDEQYFVNFMRWFMLGMDHTPYQMPGLSFIISPFVYFFGDNWFSWRFPIVIFGMVFLYFYYKVIEHISNKKIALLTTIILSLSPLIFVHSSLLLRDIPVMALGFMAIYLYFKQKYYFSALVIGLAGLIKETAIFFIIFITLHYVITNYQIIIMKLLSRKFSKIPIIVLLILAGSFLIPLTIYENTITVLEYRTSYPEFLIYDDPQFKAELFIPNRITQEILDKPLSEFNYMDKVKDPIHHLYLYVTKGYYEYNLSEDNGFIASFLPIRQNGDNIDVRIDKEITFIENGVEKHVTQFDLHWSQSMVNYSYWMAGFWGIIIMISYSLYNKIKNQKVIPKQELALIAGFTFFVPFLLIEMVRNSYAYYLIYYIPFMAFGLVLIIHKIPNKKIKTVVLSSFLIVIFVNFVYYFPVKF